MKSNRQIQLQKKQIVFDCERMKYPHTGLYHFCLQLGQALLTSLHPTEDITFFTSKKNEGIFGAGEKYLYQKAIHKLFFPSVKKYHVWHVTHQHSMYHPSANKIPVVLTIHDLNFLKGGLKNNTKQKLYLRNLQHKINHAHHLVTISNYVLNDLKKHIDIGSKPTSVIYNGCNIHRLTNRSRPDFFITTPFLFTIGTIAEKKNFHTLPRLLKNNQFTLLIAGVIQDKNYQLKILEEASRLGVTDRIHFVGAVTENDKQWYYEHCTAFVFPSIAEGFGLPVIEAMAFGKPVFLSTHTSLPEIGGDYAFYFPDFEPTTMQKVLEEGLQQYQQVGLTEAIQAHARKFNWMSSAQQYLEIYRSFF